MFCDKCGNNLPDNAKFCDKCGNRVAVATQQSNNGFKNPERNQTGAGYNPNPQQTYTPPKPTYTNPTPTYTSPVKTGSMSQSMTTLIIMGICFIFLLLTTSPLEDGASCLKTWGKIFDNPDGYFESIGMYFEAGDEAFWMGVQLFAFPFLSIGAVVDFAIAVVGAFMGKKYLRNFYAGAFMMLLMAVISIIFVFIVGDELKGLELSMFVWVEFICSIFMLGWVNKAKKEG